MFYYNNICVYWISVFMCFMIIEDIMFCIRFGGMVGMLLLVEGVVDIGMKGVISEEISMW